MPSRGSWVEPSRRGRALSLTRRRSATALSGVRSSVRCWLFIRCSYYYYESQLFPFNALIARMQFYFVKWSRGDNTDLMLLNGYYGRGMQTAVDCSPNLHVLYMQKQLNPPWQPHKLESGNDASWDQWLCNVVVFFFLNPNLNIW